MPAPRTNGVIQAFNNRASALGWPFQCGLAGDFAHPPLNAALALWRDKAAGRAMPARADMTARAMKPFLTQMSLLEQVAVDGAPRYRVRLHGSALARYSGDSTGKFLEDVVHADRVDGYRALYDTMLTLRAPLRVVSHYQAPEIDYLTGESLIAPLSVPGNDTPLVLSVTYAKPRAEIVGGMAALMRGA
jgi:hypothetical protein